MNHSNTDPYYEFNRLKKSLQQVNDAISPLSMRTRKEQIEVLKTWKELVYGILYHDRLSPQYDNSINMFAEEIDRNTQHLRTNGFDLQDQRQELTRFIDTRIKPLQAHVQQMLVDLQQEVERSNEIMPTKPERFTSKGKKTDGAAVRHYRGQCQLYKHHYKSWRVPHIHILQYKEELYHLDHNLNDIKKTVSGCYSLTTRQPLTTTSTTPAGGEPNPLPTASTPGFDTYIVEEHRTKLMPYLIKNFNGLDPRFYAYMVGALIELKIVPPSTRHENKSKVHRRLKQSFGVAFPVQSWNAAINRLDPVNIDEDKRNVSEYVGAIHAFLNPETPS